MLVRPAAVDVVLCEVFNRLQGELRMHGFETILASASAVTTPNEMQRVAELGQAAASVAFERVELELVAHVWALDRATTEARLMSISLQEAEETPALLALRTVELLRSSLRERSEPSIGAKRVAAPLSASVKLEAKPSPVQSAAVPPEARFELRLESGLLWSSLRQSALPALALSGGYRIRSRWELAARFAVPLLSNHLNATGASADYRVYFAAVESRWSLALPHGITLEPLVAAGFLRCTADGHGAAPQVTGRYVSAWTVAAGLGLGVWFKPTTRLGIGSTARTWLLAPKPLLRVEEREVSLGRPLVELSLGLNYGF